MGIFLNNVPSNATSNNDQPPAPGIIQRIKGVNRLFLYTVVIPTLISIIYFGLIASDVYISESRFVVRSPDKQSMTGLGALLQGSGFARAQDDSFAVHDYILSRDALQNLNRQFALNKIFSSDHIDPFSRFGALDWDTSFEALLRYYQKHVTVETDTTSSISTLTVNAYTSQDAYRINESLLEMSEKLVNQLNERGRQDMIRFATAEVTTAEQKAKTAALAVSRYRNQKNIFDPIGQSALQLQLISKLQDQLIATKNQFSQIRSLTRDNPQIPALQKQITSLEADISNETAKVAGSGGSLSNKAVEYERLKLESMFADKQLAGAFASLEQARNEALRKQFYLERIVQPNKPDTAIEPRRVRAILATFALGMLMWGVLSIMVAGVREHHDR